MKKSALICAMVGIIATLFAGVVNAWCFSPYIGIDAQGRHTSFTRNAGRGIFKHDYPQGNIYAGVRLSDYFGIEAGYEWTKRVHKNSTIAGGQPFLGTVTFPGDTHITIATSRLDGWHANIVGYLPICNECTDLFASVGIVQMRAYFQPTITSFAGIATDNPRTFRKYKTIARANIGIQSILIGYLGVRATVGWENTSRIKAFPTDLLTLNNAVTERVKMRDSFIYGVGIFFSFL